MSIMDYDVFGDLDNRVIWTNTPEMVKEGSTVTITNSNCEFEYDSVNEEFEFCTHAFIVSLKIIDTDFSQYVPEKSNNGGCYAFATAEVLKIKEIGY